MCEVTNQNQSGLFGSVKLIYDGPGCEIVALFPWLEALAVGAAQLLLCNTMQYLLDS